MEMVDRDKRLILNDRGIHLIAELASECGISNRSVCYLGMSKISALWVPRNPNMQDRQKKGSGVKIFWKRTMPIQKNFAWNPGNKLEKVSMGHGCPRLLFLHCKV